MIKIEHLSKTYKRLVLNDISVTFPERQVSVIVGINGSGKTIFLDCVVGSNARVKVRFGSTVTIINLMPSSSKSFTFHLIFIFRIT